MKTHAEVMAFLHDMRAEARRHNSGGMALRQLPAGLVEVRIDKRGAYRWKLYGSAVAFSEISSMIRYP
jgi:hypothetical protein